MAKNAFELKTIIRGRSAEVISPEAKATYCALGNTQPLFLVPEPTNPKDASAILCTDLGGQPCGYVAHEHAPLVAAKIKAGWVLLARTAGPCLCIQRSIFIWSEGEAEREVESEFKLPAPKKKNKVLEPANGGWEEPNNPKRKYV